MKLFPKNFGKQIKNLYKEAIEEVGVPICLYMDSATQDCPNCLSNPDGSSLNVYDSSFLAPTEIFGETINPVSFTRGRCPVCYGKGYLENQNASIKRITAIVRWNPSGAGDTVGDLDYTPAGIEGFNNVLVKTFKCHYDDLSDCNKAVIDGVDCKLLVPPVLRKVKLLGVVAIAFFSSIDPGHKTVG